MLPDALSFAVSQRRSKPSSSTRLDNSLMARVLLVRRDVFVTFAL